VLHNQSGQNRRGVVEAPFAKGFKPASIGELDWSRLHTLEVTGGSLRASAEASAWDHYDHREPAGVQPGLPQT